MRIWDFDELMAGYKREDIDPTPYYWYTDQVWWHFMSLTSREKFLTIITFVEIDCVGSLWYCDTDSNRTSSGPRISKYWQESDGVSTSQVISGLSQMISQDINAAGNALSAAFLLWIINISSWESLNSFYSRLYLVHNNGWPQSLSLQHIIIDQYWSISISLSSTCFC